MVSIPFEVFIANVTLGHIYHFKSNKISSTEPHFFVLTGTCSSKINYIFHSCTSQFDKRLSFINARKLDYCTLVPIQPDSTNNMSDPKNCVDCNTPTPHTIEELKAIYYSTGIQYKGYVSDIHLEQLYKGVHSSIMVDGWIKDIIPKSIQSAS